MSWTCQHRSRRKAVDVPSVCQILMAHQPARPCLIQYGEREKRVYEQRQQICDPAARGGAGKQSIYRSCPDGVFVMQLFLLCQLSYTFSPLEVETIPTSPSRRTYRSFLTFITCTPARFSIARLFFPPELIICVISLSSTIGFRLSSLRYPGRARTYRTGGSTPATGREEKGRRCGEAREAVETRRSSADGRADDWAGILGWRAVLPLFFALILDKNAMADVDVTELNLDKASRSCCEN